jgi:hypothetical protein
VVSPFEGLIPKAESHKVESLSATPPASHTGQAALDSQDGSQGREAGTLTRDDPAGQDQQIKQADDILDMLMSRISTPADIEFLKVCVYCRTGIGKTTFCASGPNPLIYDIDDTTVSLNNIAKYRNTPRLPYRSPYQFEMLLDKFIEGKFPQYKTFSVDSLTIFQNKSLKDQLRTQLGIIKDDKDAALKATLQGKSMLDSYLNLKVDYNANTQYMEDIFARLDAIPGHVILTCHLKNEKDEHTGAISVRPDLSPKVYQSLCRWSNIIGHLEVNGNTRTLQIRPDRNVDAKSHIGGPKFIENPTFDSLLKIAEENKYA